MTPRFRSTLVLATLAALALGEGHAQRAEGGARVAVPARPRGGDSVFVPILTYHGIFPHHPGQTPQQVAYDVAPEAFEAQMAYLRDHDYHVISLAACIEALESGRPLPERSVVITFDDGRANQFVHAFPVLRQFGYTATFFVYPNPVGRREEFMTWDQVRELQRAGMTIGSHSQTHPYLTKIADPRELKREIEGSKARLERQLGVPIEFFAYPFGARNATVEAAVRSAGYRAARAFPGRAWQDRSDLFALKGLQIGDNLKAFARAVERPQVTVAPAPSRSR